jgi:subtilisin family serine protease
MSSPHTAGAVALMLQANPALKPLEIRDRLQNHADPKVWNGNPALGFLDVVGRQGAGMIDVA